MTKNSTYFFIGKLSDQSSKYFVNELPLKGNFYLEVLLDGIALWGNTKKNLDKLLPQVREIFDVLLSAFVFKTKKPLNYSLTNWVETKEIIAKKNVIGWILNPYSSKTHYSRRSKYNTAWKKAGWFYNNLSKGNNNHILALKDYRTALTDSSHDSFLFAYRSVEDICRAVTGCKKIEGKDWDKMRKTIKVSKKFLDPLINVSKAVRHGNVNQRVVTNAKKNRDKFLNIAYTVVDKEFKRTFSGFF